MDDKTLLVISKDVAADREPGAGYTREMRAMYTEIANELAEARKKNPNAYLWIPGDGVEGLPDAPARRKDFDADEPRDNQGEWSGGGGGGAGASHEEKAGSDGPKSAAPKAGKVKTAKDPAGAEAKPSRPGSGFGAHFKPSGPDAKAGDKLSPMEQKHLDLIKNTKGKLSDKQAMQALGADHDTLRQSGLAIRAKLGVPSDKTIQQHVQGSKPGDASTKEAKPGDLKQGPQPGQDGQPHHTEEHPKPASSEPGPKPGEDVQPNHIEEHPEAHDAHGAEAEVEPSRVAAPGDKVTWRVKNSIAASDIQQELQRQGLMTYGSEDPEHAKNKKAGETHGATPADVEAAAKKLGYKVEILNHVQGDDKVKESTMHQSEKQSEKAIKASKRALAGNSTSEDHHEASAEHKKAAQLARVAGDEDNAKAHDEASKKHEALGDKKAEEEKKAEGEGEEEEKKGIKYSTNGHLSDILHTMSGELDQVSATAGEVKNGEEGKKGKEGKEGEEGKAHKPSRAHGHKQAGHPKAKSEKSSSHSEESEGFDKEE